MRRHGWVVCLFAGCAVNGSADTAPAVVLPIKVLTTTGMIADVARNVGGDRVFIEALMGPGVDPHQYRASAGDLAKLQSADLVLFNGLHLEGKMADVLEQLGKRRRCVAVTRDLNPATDLRPAPEGFEGAHDPHVWFDVRLWVKVVDVVRDQLAEIDPAHAADYARRADAYRNELTALHEEVLRKAESIPKDRRVLITAHDAFYYFGRAYGFEVHGLQGVSTASEFNTRDVQQLASLIGTRRIPAIFGETSVPDRNLKAVVDAVERDHGFRVNFVAGQLFSDALGDVGTPAGTYAGMVRHNIDAMVAALK